LVGREIVVEIIWVWLSHFLGDGDFFPKFLRVGRILNLKRKMSGGRKNETNRNPKRKFVKMKGKKNETKRNEKDAKKKKKRTRVINNDGLWGWYGVYFF
jgi:hypothetical protein